MEIFDLLHQRRADQPAIQAVCPGMIWTLNGLPKTTFAFFTHVGAAVAAYIIKGADFPVLVAQDNDAFAKRLDQEVVACIWDAA